MELSKQRERDADFARIFTGDRQIVLTHFYSVSDCERGERFAFGYVTHDDVFFTGVAVFRDGEFSMVE